ncbi:hypothetical protein GCT13_06745 [Paraburkholderia sp. CNPSo 3157]|uniref:Uncharacterized protein n=1 Tax=Paraburkholderia franconis TaxID=2654983 RepID=A0A7X1N767_9BURK|nr:hypothetical protein [Paraburkholderia franconis]MPW16640.1 hypothetical protein [Paraburkholderia franconis]
MASGATIGDALIELIDFARSEPLVFLEVMLPLLIAGLFVSFFIFRIIIDPVGLQKSEYDEVRKVMSRHFRRSTSK